MNGSSCLRTGRLLGLLADGLVPPSYVLVATVMNLLAESFFLELVVISRVKNDRAVVQVYNVIVEGSRDSMLGSSWALYNSCKRQAARSRTSTLQLHTYVSNICGFPYFTLSLARRVEPHIVS